MGNLQTVFVVDDDQAVRDSLRWLIESVGLRAVTFASADAFASARHEDGPACILLDVRLPGTSGLELQRLLRQTGRRTPIILVTGHGDIPMAVKAMKDGAFDFIEKPFDDHVLLTRIRQALAADVDEQEQQALRALVASRLALLTRREREVFDQVVQGRLNKVAAEALGVSPKTVEVHRAHMMRKMQAGSVADLVRMSLLIEGLSRIE